MRLNGNPIIIFQHLKRNHLSVVNGAIVSKQCEATSNQSLWRTEVKYSGVPLFASIRCNLFVVGTNVHLNARIGRTTRSAKYTRCRSYQQYFQLFPEALLSIIHHHLLPPKRQGTISACYSILKCCLVFSLSSN